MSAAVDIALLDAAIQYDLLERYREVMHKAIDQFVDALAGDLTSSKPMTVVEIAQAIGKAKPALLTAAMEEFIRSKHGDILSLEQAECPCCGRQVRRSAQAPRTIECIFRWKLASDSGLIPNTIPVGSRPGIPVRFRPRIPVIPANP